MKTAERAPTCGVDLCWCEKSSMVTPREEPEKSITSCGGNSVVSKRVEGVATRLISVVAAVFFVSLERCSMYAGESRTLMVTEVEVGQLANPLFAEEEEHKA
ncbi:unnamed protein product [Withania somnifera]